jgi:hypothetical protein
MTKQDFELIAGTLRSQRSCIVGTDSLGRPVGTRLVAVLDETITNVATALQTTNPRFDRDRFIAACMGEDSYDSAGRKVRYSATV